MSLKAIFTILTACVCMALTSTALASTRNDAEINHKIENLQKQINELRQDEHRKQLHHPASTNTKPTSAKVPIAHRSARVSIGPYLNQEALFDGSDLIINIPSVRESARLLMAQARLDAELKQYGIVDLLYPRLTFSGKLEGQVSFNSTYAGSSLSNINFSVAELDTYVQANHWVSGYMALDYDPDDVNNGSKLFLNRAFITIGNLSSLPVYLNVGQIFVPFGRYSSAMITAPVTLGLGRTRARTLELGYQQVGQNALHSEIYAFQGLTNNINRTNTNDEWGADLGYNYKLSRVSGEIGAGYISNLADSQGMQATVFLNDENLVHAVGAVDVFGTLAINPVVFIVEYIATVRRFAPDDVNFANRGAEPTALHTEASYTFNTGSKPSSIGIGYDHTVEAMALGLPQDRYSIFYNVNIWKDTNLAIEYRHDVNYGLNAATTTLGDNTPADVIADLGKSDNVVTVAFDLFF